MPSTGSNFLSSLSQYLQNTSAIGSALSISNASSDFLVESMRASPEKLKPDPLHASFDNAIAYLQEEQFRKGNTRRKHQTHDAPHALYGSHIAMVERSNGPGVKPTIWVLHATKGWKIGPHR